MIKRNTIKLLFLLSISGMAYLCGCSKATPASAPASIVGTWSLNSEKQLLLIGSATFRDTTMQLSSLHDIYSFTADGYYAIFTPLYGTLGGGYIVNGNTVSLFDSSSHPATWDNYFIDTLTANNLVLQDTFFHQSDTLYLVSVYLSR